MKIENIDIKKITKYSKNYKIHDERQINLISESIKKFGFRNPVLIDSNNVIIAGHGRVMGAEKLGLKEVPCILVDNLSEEEIKAYRIADNKLAELAKDDIELLSLELKEIEGLDLDFKLDILGIDDDYYAELMDYGDDEDNENNSFEDDSYSKKIKAPLYEPKNEKPETFELYNLEKYNELIEQIQKEEITKEEKEFLMFSAQRHIVFNYEKIADFYSHSKKNVQELMENSALIIIDFDKAIENGYVKLSNNIKEMYVSENE